MIAIKTGKFLRNPGPGDYRVGPDFYVRSHQGTSLTKAAEYYVNFSGQITTKFKIWQSGSGGTVTVNGRVYVNGIAVGTSRSFASGGHSSIYSEDITVNAGDLVQLYTSINSGAYTVNARFGLFGAVPVEAGSLYSQNDTVSP